MKTIISLLLGLLLTSPCNAQSPATDDTRVVLSAPVTHPDWILNHSMYDKFGPESVRYILDTCKAAGWTRVYWRVLDGGKALYKSSLVDPECGVDADNMFNPSDPNDMKYVASKLSPETRLTYLTNLGKLDYRDFDTLREAVRYGHKIGLEVHAWIPINEDDHGWGYLSRFSRQHPEYRWKKRSGVSYRSQISFAFPEVRKYKLAIIKELLDNYQLDGIFLDWIRTGDNRDNPQNDPEGVADYGYEEPLIKGFLKEYGIDPHDIANGDDRWVNFRAQPVTEFMRSVRKLVDSRKRHIPVAVIIANPWGKRGNDKIDGTLRGMLCDVRAWAKEGLIDEAVAAGYYVGDGNGDGNVESATKWLQDEVGERVKVWLYGWMPVKPEDFIEQVERTKKFGINQILFWEGDYIDARSNKKELVDVMSKHAAH